jgi:hypothetical protein
MLLFFLAMARISGRLGIAFQPGPCSPARFFDSRSIQARMPLVSGMKRLTRKKIAGTPTTGSGMPLSRMEQKSPAAFPESDKYSPA